MGSGVTHLTVRNGLTLAYVIAAVNALLSLLISFGVQLSDPQQATIVAFVNASVLLAARVLHLPERTPDGGTIRVAHPPVLVKETPGQPPEITAAPLAEGDYTPPR